jgi:hypothetical protein
MPCHIHALYPNFSLYNEIVMELRQIMCVHTLAACSTNSAIRWTYQQQSLCSQLLPFLWRILIWKASLKPLLFILWRACCKQYGVCLQPLLGDHATVDVTWTLQALWRLFTTFTRRPRNSRLWSVRRIMQQLLGSGCARSSGTVNTLWHNSREQPCCPAELQGRVTC